MIYRRMTCWVLGTISLLCATASATTGDCYQDPTICLVKPFEACLPCKNSPVQGCCVPSPQDIDCYATPGVCGSDKWCQIMDRKSWNETEKITRGRCIQFQNECESCTSSLLDDSTRTIPGLDAGAFYSQSEKQLGTFLVRLTRCDPNQGLICTGNAIPSLPATCVKRRKLPPNADKATPAQMYMWVKRFLRMGATNLEGVTNRNPSEQQPQGCSRKDIEAGVNMIVKSLWNSNLWGEYKDMKVESTFDELCCRWKNYTDKLSAFQANRTGPSYRNPLNPHDPNNGNAPPCVWCSFDGAYNDENPSVWSLLHALTFNLPDVISAQQFHVLQSIPIWLRQHLSCPLCRSHIHEHLINLGIPQSHQGQDWARFFWRAHNYVNEQSEVTRCGSMACGWGVWNTPPAYKCAGNYRYPWYLSFADATSQWQITNSTFYN